MQSNSDKKIKKANTHKMYHFYFNNKTCFHWYERVGYNKQNNFLHFIRGKDSRAEYTGALIKIKNEEIFV